MNAYGSRVPFCVDEEVSNSIARWWHNPVNKLATEKYTLKW